jgi:predicted RecA/RadA family phage recombinase
MKKFVQPGDILTLTVPSGGVVKDIPKQIGQIVVVPTSTVAYVAGTEYFEGLVTGVVDVPKIGSQAWTEGAVVFWDEGNDRATTSGAGNIQLGVAVQAVGSGASETTGRVRLDGIGREQGT